ncbi:MAG: cobalamin-dependent protein [Deltaproteobacteria bacterium]|nr:cobalamin-dependent protein [Deltaproteobacteria bacterium]
MTGKRAKVVLGKIGLDGHDNGIRTVAKWLVDAGCEVVYLGLYNSPEVMVRAAVEEGANVLGVSFLGGEHLFYSKRLMDLIGQEVKSPPAVVVGGVIPPDDVDQLKKLGVAAVFTPGAPREGIIGAVDSVVN